MLWAGWRKGGEEEKNWVFMGAGEGPPNLSLGQAGRTGWRKASSKPERDRKFGRLRQEDAGRLRVTPGSQQLHQARFNHLPQEANPLKQW